MKTLRNLIETTNKNQIVYNGHGKDQSGSGVITVRHDDGELAQCEENLRRFEETEIFATDVDYEICLTPYEKQLIKDSMEMNGLMFEPTDWKYAIRFVDRKTVIIYAY